MTESAKQEDFVKVYKSDLPLHCPTNEMKLWNTHPRVYLPIEKSGQVTCPYCGTKFVLQND